MPDIGQREDKISAAPIDMWANRNVGMRCKSCLHFVQKAVSGPVGGPEEVILKIGRCRRHAPTMTGFPVVFGNDWCGDHKLDETK